MLKIERQRFILSEITRYKTLKNKWLCDELGVSSETIRRDLEEMEKDGMLIRVHGGAYLNYKNVREVSFVDREQIHVPDKKKIAEKCVEFVHEDEIIALDVSTTNTEIARSLGRHFDRLTILTNSMIIANELAQKNEFTIIMPGGVLRNSELCFVGESSASYMAQFHADIFFMSFSGINLNDGITDYGLGESQIKMAMFHNASTVYAVGDHNKFERVSLIRICPALQPAAIITDDGLPEALVKKYENQGINLFLGSGKSK